MGVVPVLHADSGVRTALRRGFRKSHSRVISCRSLDQVERILGEELVDAVVLDVRAGLGQAGFDIIESYPRIPVFAFSAFRPEDGRLLASCLAAGFRGILLDGIDEPIAGEFIAARSAASERRALLADAARRLRLSESLQLAAWEEVLASVERPSQTDHIAETLGVTREHLSREFAAGGAPNLKRVIDLVRTACAAHLLANPGHTVAAVSRILHFSSASHLARCTRRIAGVTPRGLAALGTRGVLSRFLKGRTRSHWGP